MNQHLGASYTLSVLIVIGFALLMAKSDITVPTRREVAPKSNPRVKSIERSTEPVAQVKAAPKQGQGQIEASIVMPASSPVSLARPISHVKPATALKPRGEFTTVRPGESLVEVARRVYGTEAHVAKLWHANRDQLPDRSTTPRVGMTLRTP
jgi:nucleoid-associated protein YgaU